jgi:hypothetical protein
MKSKWFNWLTDGAMPKLSQTTSTEMKRCGTCLCFRYYPKFNDVGECRAHPEPVRKDADDWCREYEATR